MDHREHEWDMAQIDTDMGMGMGYRDADLSQPLHTDSKALWVVIIAAPRCPARARHASRAGDRHAWLFGTFGVPLRVYLGLKFNSISPAFLRALRPFAVHVIYIVDPIWLGVQALIALQILFPSTSIVTSHHTNLSTHAGILGYPYFHHRTWQIHACLHSFARYTLVPFPSTACLLRENGWGNLKVVGRGVDGGMFSSTHRSPALYASWGASGPTDVVLLSVDRLSPQKNLGLMMWGVVRLDVVASFWREWPWMRRIVLSGFFWSEVLERVAAGYSAEDIAAAWM
ncbi:hypothetical protein B0H13DRAFT_1931367 [Mycena leptocephala]|nr:hypothetical protein B0H13DRAFT_1931367 [Mycena leptocephala]